MESENQELSDNTTKLRNRLTLLDRDYRSLEEEAAKLRATPVSVDAPVVKVSGRDMGVPDEPATPINASSATSSASARGSVELPPIVVRKGYAEAMRSIRSRVIDSDEAHGFVVLDKGSDDGIQMSMTFEIMRGDQTVGQVTAIRVRSHLSACTLVSARSSSFPKVGDLAIQYVP